MPNATAGIALLIVAGVMNAGFTLPMKFTRKWAWENTWAIWSIYALLVLPALTASVTIPRLGAVYAQAGAGKVMLVAVCGFAWGIAQVLFGLSVQAIGIALAFAIVLGLSAAIGSLIPLIQLHPDKLFAPAGLGVIAGVVLVVLGVSVCAIAGKKREQASSGKGDPQHSRRMPFSAGLTCAVLSGFGAAAMNFGVAFGGSVTQAAVANGAEAVWSINAVWFPLMVAGFVPNLVYCLYLMSKNKTLGNYGSGDTGTYWLLAAVMAFFWFASTVMYGVASAKLGELGAVLGWPFFMSLIVIMATVYGVLTGEWKNAGKIPFRIQMTGVAILVLAVVVLSRAGQAV
jgi:L-rhamnose-H+ transport protein